MSRLAVSLGITVLMAAAVPAWAQNPTNGNNGKVVATIKAPSATAPKAVDTRFAAGSKTTPATTNEPAITPEMWYYQQYQQQVHNPAEMVYQRADARANQRMQRLAAMKWFGYSNSRPQSGADVTNGDRAPGWVSNNASYPYQYSGYGTTEVFLIR